MGNGLRRWGWAGMGRMPVASLGAAVAIYLVMGVF